MSGRLAPGGAWLSFSVMLRDLPARFATQVQRAWTREGAPPDPGFRLARPLIVLCGVVSLVLLAVAVATIINLDGLWQYHEAAGFALLPVLALKLVPVGLRASGYYLQALAGRLRSGRVGTTITPPVLVARLAAGPLVLATALLLGSGIVMWHTGDQRSVWSTVHNASAIAGGVLLAVHLACHARSTLALGIRSLRAPDASTVGNRIPPFLVAGSLVAGIVLAVFTVPNASWHGGIPDRRRPPVTTITTSPRVPAVVSAFRAGIPR